MHLKIRFLAVRRTCERNSEREQHSTPEEKADPSADTNTQI